MTIPLCKLYNFNLLSIDFVLFFFTGIGINPIFLSGILFLWSSTKTKGDVLLYLWFPSNLRYDELFSIYDDNSV